MSGKTLIAELPPMRAADLKEFEESVKPWGEQRSIRRQQLQMATAGAMGGSAFGWIWPVAKRGNTSLVGGFMIIGCGLAGFIAAHTVALNVIPSVASNSETTMMRRLWWAQKCSADFNYSLPSDWSSKYPKLDSSKLE
eukprot:Sspe_Gene.75841::Locus_47386_Transcript_1_1_Confidence_1.000_Length_561::g.75841::m.75841